MFKPTRRPPTHRGTHTPFARRCDSCDAVATGTVTFFSDDGPHPFSTCLACATDALFHSGDGVRVRYRSATTRAEVWRGTNLGGAA